MKRRRRKNALSFTQLEDRCLLSVGMTWHGQDGADYITAAGFKNGQDGFQDDHITITGLPSTATIQDVFANRNGGGGQWEMSNGSIYVNKPAGSTSAEIYFDAVDDSVGQWYDTFWVKYNNTTVQVTDGNSHGGGFVVAGSPTSNNLRVAGQQLALSSLGQDGPDLEGPSPSVGADGQIDYHLHLANLSPQDSLDYITIDSTHGEHWSTQPTMNGDSKPSGAWDAELFLGSGSTTGELYFQPPIGVNLGTLTVKAHYYIGKSDSNQITIPATSNDPVTAPTPFTISYPGVAASWSGQITQAIAGVAPAGSVHLALSGLPTGVSVSSIILNNETSFSWVYNPSNGSLANLNDGQFALTYVPSSTDATKGDLYFAPNRNEVGSNLSVRIKFSNGQTSYTVFGGMASDPNAYDPAPALPATPRTVTPADAANLQSILNSNAWVQLGAGVYSLSSPLVLSNAVTLTTAPGAVATLQFTQPASTSWTDVIQIQKSHTHLSGFQITFSGAVQHIQNVNFPAAVIHVVNSANTPLVDTQVTGITFTAPAAANTSDANSFVAIRTDGSTSGWIGNNVIIGQSVYIDGGPWIVSGNDYQGALANTQIFQAFTAWSDVHDLQLINNRVHQVASTGETDRFLYQKSSSNATVAGNEIYGGIGQPVGVNRNLPESVLTDFTEPYFIGTPTYLSSDGRVLQLSMLRNGNTPVAGFVVSIISGDYTGTKRWFRVGQVVNGTTLLMEDPLPTTGNYAISLNYGYRNNTYDHNTFDLAGTNPLNLGLALDGGQFGTIVSNNVFHGGNAFRVGASITQPPLGATAYPAPDIWSRIPAYDINLTGNEFDDTNSVNIYASNDSRFSASVNRVYFTGAFTNNTYTYSTQFLSTLGTVISSASVGDSGFLNTSEYNLTKSGNAYQFQSASSQQPKIVYNGGIAGSTAATTLVAAPSIPGNLAATAGASQITLTWSSVASATNYAIERSPNGQFAWGLIGTASGTSTSYVDTSVQPSTTYVYRIRVLTSNGYSPYTSTVSATTGPPGVVPVDLSSSFNQVGITTAANPTAGSFDQYGNSYSAQDLGSAVTWGTTTFNIGPAGVNDVIGIGGVPITLPQGNFTSLQILGAAIRGVQNAVSFRVHYTDGSYDSFSQAFSDWSGGYTGAGTTAPGETLVKTMGYHDTTTGRVAGNVYLYGYSFPLNPNKTVSYTEVPNNNNVKILAIDEVSQPPQVNLTTSFNQGGITTAANPTAGSFDPYGNSYSSQDLGSSVTWGSQTFTFGPAGANDAIGIGGVPITLPQGNFTSLQILGAGVRGVQNAVSFRVHYTDGSYDSFSQAFSDWAGGYTGPGTTAPGETLVKTMSYHDEATGRVAGTVYLYGYSFPLNPAKTVAYTEVPNNNNVKILAINEVSQPTQADLNAAPNGTSTAFNQMGITTDSNVGFGNLDGSGNTYSANALGNTVTWNAQSFNIGATTLNDVVQAAGQSVVLRSGSFTNLMLLGASTSGVQTGSIKVYYSDGSFDTVSLTFSNWRTGYTGAGTTAPGESIAKAMTYFNNNTTGKVTQNAYLYGYTIPVNRSKTVASILLPNNNNIKILAIDEVSQLPQVDLNAAPNGSSTAFNQIGITTDGNVGFGNLDGAGNTYSANALGNTVTWNSQSFNIGATTINDVVQASGQSVTLPAGNFTNILLLGAATNGVQTGSIKVYYSDGTFDTVSLTFSDWRVGYTGAGTTAPGESIAKTMTYLNNNTTGKITQNAYLYGYTIPVNHSKTVASILLPTNNNIKILAIDEV